MKVVALISGGKDSCYNMMQCVAEGHEIVALANVRPTHKDELDSYMFQTVGHHAIELYSEAIGLPLYRGWIKGQSLEQGKDYVVTDGDEVEDLYQLLEKVKTELGVEAVSVGAILSNYQRVRVENVCSRLGLTVLAYLWQRNQEELLDEMINCGVIAIIIKVATLGLTEQHLGKTLSEMQQHMLRMKEKYQINVCGEGGEYETLTLDCPLFNKRIIIDKQESVLHSDDAFSSVHYLQFHQLHLQEKQMDTNISMFDRVKFLPMKLGNQIHKELGLSNVIENIENKDESVVKLSTMQLQQSTYIDSLKRCKLRKGFLKISGINVRRPYKDDKLEIQKATEAALIQVKDLLARYKMTCEDVVVINLYVCNMTYYKDINSIFPQFFPLNPPVRVCVQVDFFNERLFEMDCLAHRYNPLPNDMRNEMHKTMHVQSISHWAPANIGPYSQAVQIDDMVFCAGVIGLCPSSMKLIDGGAVAECRLSLRSVDRILSAMTFTMSISNVIMSVCYVTSSSYIQTAKVEWKAYQKYKIESSELDESHCPCLITFVVVPSLPRKAGIEWHVTANSNQYNWQYLQRAYDICGFKFSSESLFSPEDGVATLLIGASCCTQKIDLMVLLKNIVELLHSCIPKIGFEKDQTLYMQIFFHQDLVQHEQLKTGMAEILDDPDQTCVVFIPAKELETPDRVVTISCWLYQ